MIMRTFRAAAVATALSALCVDAEIAEQYEVTPPTQGTLSAELATDDTCSLGDEECGLSLRQLRGKDVQAHVAAHVQGNQDTLADEADRKLLAGLIARAANSDQGAAKTVDKGIYCKVSHPGYWGPGYGYLFRIADKDGDGEVRLQDIKDLAGDLGESGEKRLRELFEYADADGSKGLSKQEVEQTLQKMEQVRHDGQASGKEDEADRELIANLLARTGQKADVATLDRGIYCKGHTYGWNYLLQERASDEEAGADARGAAEAQSMPQATDMVGRTADMGDDDEADRKLLAGLVARAANSDQGAAKTVDKGIYCKVSHPGYGYGYFFHIADKDGDGEVRLQDITDLAGDLGESGEKRLRELFEYADTDGSKRLSKQEVAQTLQKMEQVRHDGQASGKEDEADRELIANLLARTGQKADVATLDRGIYCKGHTYGWNYLLQERASDEEAGADARGAAEAQSMPQATDMVGRTADMGDDDEAS